MVWPTAIQSLTDLDAGGDSIKQARAQLKSLGDKVNAMIQSDGAGWFSQIILPWVDISNMFNTTVSGTGAAITGAIHSLFLDNGSTTAGKVSIGTKLLNSVNAVDQADASMAVVLEVELLHASLTAGVDCYIVLSSSGANPWVPRSAGADEIGWRLNGSDLYTYSSNAGTYTEVDTTYAPSLRRMLRIVLTSGQIDFYMNDDLLRSETNSSYIPSNAVFNFHALLDGKSVASGRQLVIGQPRIAMQRTY